MISFVSIKLQQNMAKESMYCDECFLPSASHFACVILIDNLFLIISAIVANPFFSVSFFLFLWSHSFHAIYLYTRVVLSSNNKDHNQSVYEYKHTQSIRINWQRERKKLIISITIRKQIEIEKLKHWAHWKGWAWNVSLPFNHMSIERRKKKWFRFLQICIHVEYVNNQRIQVDFQSSMYDEMLGGSGREGKKWRRTRTYAYNYKLYASTVHVFKHHTHCTYRCTYYYKICSSNIICDGFSFDFIQI